MNKVCYISDLLLADLIGGGELNDHELCVQLDKEGLHVEKKRSNQIKAGSIDKDMFYIISNFIRLPIKSLEYIKNNCNYIIYEHDHKYLKCRNPAMYENYKAPKNELVNIEFYQKAKKVFCQSSFHEK